MVFFCNLIGTVRSMRRKSTTFLSNATRLSPPPRSFFRRELGHPYSLIPRSLLVSFPDHCYPRSHLQISNIYLLLGWAQCLSRIWVHVLCIAAVVLQLCFHGNRRRHDDYYNPTHTWHTTRPWILVYSYFHLRVGPSTNGGVPLTTDNNKH